MTRTPSIFIRRKLVRQKTPLCEAAASQQPHFYRWEVLVNASLAAMQFIAIVFLYFAFQAQERALHAQQHALTEQVFARLDQQDSAIGKLFLEHPELRTYFYEGALPPTGKDKNSVKIRRQVETLADIHLAFIETFDNEYVRGLPGMEFDGKYDKAWTAYFLELFKKSPALCQRYLEVQTQYSPSMCEKYARFSCRCTRSALK